jgi:hypothetical protein
MNTPTADTSGGETTVGSDLRELAREWAKEADAVLGEE